MPNPPGKKKFKNTDFGQRALTNALLGIAALPNPDGTESSVRTATFDIPGPRGRTDVMVAPTIRFDEILQELLRLPAQEAAMRALETGDFVRVKGGKTKKKIEAARAKGDKKSRKFSKRLGDISARRAK